MAFDIGAGLAEAGKSLAQTAQAYTLESQKAELEQEKIKLADQLAGAREEKQRSFVTSEREATQKFTGGENALNRDNVVKLANISAAASIQSAGIHAGATLGAARMNIDARRAEAAEQRKFEGEQRELDRGFRREERTDERQFQSGEKALDRAADKERVAAQVKSHMDGISAQILAQSNLQQSSQEFQSKEKALDREQQKPLLDAEVIQKQVKAASDQIVLDARKDLQTATQSGDAAKIEAAKQNLAVAEYTSKDDFQQVVAYQAQARLIEANLSNKQAKLAALQSSGSASFTPEGKQAIAAMTREVERLQRDFDTAVAAARQAITRLPTFGATPSGTVPDLSKYIIRPPAAPQPGSLKMPGLINTAPDER